MKYDVIVVGARCGGASTALLLARQGYRVLLVDKSTFPSDSVNGILIQPHGGAYLERWGLLEKVQATNCPAITQVALDFGTFALEASPLPADGVAAVYAPFYP